jgi:5-formyltetrahydrofolate cyclo-ligase
MEFFKIDGLEGPWHTGSFGILEPEIHNNNQFHLDTVDFPLLIIVPCVAFDKNGNRLGHGKGYYDRFLLKIKKSSQYITENISIMGLCLQEQIFDHVPTDDGDQRVDVIYAGNHYIETK